MKVVLTGSTGFIGGEVLEQCVQHPSVTSIVALSRRQISGPAAADPKVRVVIVDDYLNYTPATLEAIQGAGACIWSLGKARMPDMDVARKVSIDYTMAAARALKEQLDKDGKSKFRFVYLSGMAAERDQTKALWFMQEYRRIRGQVENEVVTYAKESKETFESYILRPGMVLKRQGDLADMVKGIGPSVKVDVLAKVMLKAALEGSLSKIMENSDINKEGREG